MPDITREGHTVEDYVAVLNLLHSYADALERGDFDRINALFSDADLYVSGRDEPVVQAGNGRLGDLIRQSMPVYPPDNAPRVRLMITNHRVHFDGSRVRVQSCFMMFQVLSGSQLAASPVAVGTYDDRFLRRGDTWQFTERHETIKATGDLRGELIDNP